MSLCIVAGATALRIAAATFALSWTHTVERTRWEEDWRVGADGLVVVQARVKGSGAGMEPGEGARLVSGWWVWTPRPISLPELRLAGSDAAPEGWRLCADGRCLNIGARGDAAAAADAPPANPFADGATLRPCP